MKRVFVALLACSCQVLTPLDEDGGSGGGAANGGGGSVGGGGATGGGGMTAGGGGGSTGGGSAGGGAGGAGGGIGAGGGAGGGGGGSCNASCNAATCGYSCAGDLCRSGAGMFCDGGLCLLPPPLLAGTGDFTAVWGSSPTDVWVAMANTFAFHWNGALWGCLPALPVNHDVWSNRDEAWIAGRDGVAPLLRFRWDGGSSTHFGGDAGFMFPSAQCVWGDGTGAVWALQPGFITALSAQSQFSQQTYSPANTGRDLKGVPGGPPELAAAGTRVFRRTGSMMWNPEPTAAVAQMIGVFPQMNGQDFAVGDNGQVERRLGGSWQNDGPTLTGSPTAMNGGAGELYVTSDLGSSGALFRRDPTLGWQEVLRHPRALRDVWVAPDGTAFVVGNAGTALKYSPPTCPYPTLPLADEFNTPIASTRWSRYGTGAWTITNGRLEGGSGTTDGQGSGLEAVLAQPGFDETSVSVELVQLASLGGSNEFIGTLFLLESPMPDMQTLKLEISNNNLKAYSGDRGSPDDVRGVPSGLRQLRFREQGNTLYFEYAPGPDGGYHPYFSVSPSPAYLANLDRVKLGVFKAPGGGGAFVPAVFDNLNRCPR